MSHKYVYLFSEGDGSMRELLGGKGANLAEIDVYKRQALSTASMVSFANASTSLSMEHPSKGTFHRKEYSHYTVKKCACQKLSVFLKDFIGKIQQAAALRKIDH